MNIKWLLPVVLLLPVTLYGQTVITPKEPVPDTLILLQEPDPQEDSINVATEMKAQIAGLNTKLSQPYDDKADKVVDLLNRGAARLKLADTSGAITDMYTALQLDSTMEYAWNMLGIIYAHQKQWQLALKAANTGLEKCEEKQRLYLLKASCYSEMDSNALAISIYDQAIDADPGYTLAFYNRGYTWFKMKNYERAIADLHTALGLQEENGATDDDDFSLKDACFYLATSYQKTAAADSALVYFDKAIAYGDYWTYYNNKTTLLTDLKRYDEALQCINKAIGLYPNVSDLYYARSNIYLDTKQYERQLQSLNEALKLDPVNISAIINKGVYYERQNNIRDAMALYRQAIALDPTRFEAYSNIANIYKSGGLQHDSTVYYYQKALEYAPDNAAIHFNYGNYFMKIKEDKKAIAEFSKVIVLNPSMVAAYNNIATVYFRKDEKANGKRYLLQGLTVDENDKNLNRNLLTLYFENAQYDSAIIIASRLLSVDDDNTNVYYKRGMSRQLLGMYDNAIYDYLDCLKHINESNMKENAGIYSNIGYCYMELKKWDPALKYFKTAVGYKPETDQLIGLFTVYYIKKDTRNFKQAFRQALAVEPKLKKGMKGIAELEAGGFFYTPAHQEILREIFSQQEQ